MECVRNSDDHLTILADDGEVLAEISAPAPGNPAFARLADEIAKLVDGSGRVLVMYRDGLPEEVRADFPCEVLLVEEDRYDDPPLRIRPRKLEKGDPSGVDRAMELLQKQIDTLKAAGKK